MTLYERIIHGETALAVIGLGYVGMPLAIAFAEKARVIGYDTNAEKIANYKNGIDATQEVGDATVRESTCHFTADERELDAAKFFIVAVPTPINGAKIPDLHPVMQASELVARHLSDGAIVMYESTVYPGVTENVCVPLLEKYSGLRCGKDFFVGYSPERINPGDPVHRFHNIVKIVSGQDAETLDTAAKVYEIVIDAGVHRAPSIQVAEAAKVVENAQRDINIAFMNEIAMAFDRMGIDTLEVIRAMNTKWNAMGFYPGLVGGHCIGVDPYYFLHHSRELGFHCQLINAGRLVNDDMPRFVVESVVRNMILADRSVKGATIAVMGVTFKPDCQDMRNSKMVEIIRMLKGYGMLPLIFDSVADPQEARRQGIECLPLSDMIPVDAMLFGVDHAPFRDIQLEELEKWYSPGRRVLIDLRGIFDRAEAERRGFSYWRL